MYIDIYLCFYYVVIGVYWRYVFLRYVGICRICFSCGLYYEAAGITSTVRNVRMTDEWWTGNDVEGSGKNLIHVLSWHIHGGTWESYKETESP
jgi:hypothetical protein